MYLILNSPAQKEFYNIFSMIKQGIIGLTIFLFAACSSDLDDKIEGKWQLKNVEEGGKTTLVDTVYYNFQNTLFMYQIANGAPGTDKVSYGYKTAMGDDEILLELPDRAFLRYTDWGTDSLRIFRVEKPSHSKLILTNEKRTYTFHKF